MSAAPSRISTDSRFAVPRPLWCVLATVMLIVVALALQFGVPIYRQQAAIREIERLGGAVDVSDGDPAWHASWTLSTGYRR
ncbi:MAG: hypothetical protein ACKV0T_14700 [Planctomycetales bacterium]